MGIIPCVVRAEYRGGHRVHLVFHDDREKTVDFSSWPVGPIFEPVRDGHAENTRFGGSAAQFRLESRISEE